MNYSQINFPTPPVHERSCRSSMRVGIRDVNLFRIMKPSALLEIFQELSVVHAASLGFGTQDVLSRGVVWVITMQRIEIKRMPQEQELIYLESWTGKTTHLMYPRFYRICDEKGELIIQASSLWTLMDIESRKMLSSEQFGHEIIDMTNGEEIALPGAPKKAVSDSVSRFAVPYSFLDQNGHMNNTRYLDLAEDLIPASLEGRKLKTIVTRYQNEVRHGDVIELQWQELGGIFRISGSGEKKYFTVNLEYYDE